MNSQVLEISKFYLYHKRASFMEAHSLSKKSVLPAKRAFEISFLPRVSRGKKHFYLSKCAG